MSTVLPDPLVVMPESKVLAQSPAVGEREILNPWGVQRDLDALAKAVTGLVTVPAARASVPGNQVYTAGQAFIVDLGSTDWETVPNMRSGDHFVFPRAGIWIGTGWIRWQGGSPPNEAFLAFQLNGVQTTQSNDTFQAAGVALNVSDHFNVEEGDELEMFAYNGDANSRTIQQGAMAISYVGAAA